MEFTSHIIVQFLKTKLSCNQQGFILIDKPFIANQMQQATVENNYGKEIKEEKYIYKYIYKLLLVYPKVRWKRSVQSPIFFPEFFHFLVSNVSCLTSGAGVWQLGDHHWLKPTNKYTEMYNLITLYLQLTVYIQR